MYKIQSVLFDKDKYTLKEAVRFLINHNYRHSKVDETENFYRFRQIDPYMLAGEGYKTVVTKNIGDGIKFIIYYK
jgi:hypothetical protein